MTQLSKIHTPAQRAAKVLAIGIVAFSGISAIVAQADAQSVFASPNTEAAYTVVALNSVATGATETSGAFMLASLPSATPRAQVASPIPRFDLHETAARYVALVREADRMANLSSLSTEAIAQALRVTSQTSGKGISEGAGAYATQVAASNPEFASGLRTTVNLLGRDVVLERLKTNPDAFLAMIAGSRQASRSASGALAASEAKLARASEVLGEAAYSVQTQNWSQRAVDTQATLAAHRQAANVPMGRADAVDLGASPPMSDAPINGRYLLAASYQLLGEDGAATEVLDKPLGRMCMNRVQLNVRQCLAASQYPYEHLFCLSRHSFGETLGCVKDSVK
jgi:hypothetical protein